MFLETLPLRGRRELAWIVIGNPMTKAKLWLKKFLVHMADLRSSRSFAITGRLKQVSEDANSIGTLPIGTGLDGPQKAVRRAIITIKLQG